MKFLLDTCTFLWICIDAPELSVEARNLIIDSDNDIYLSAVSAWEIATKYNLGKLALPCTPGEFISSRREKYLISSMPLSEQEATHSGNLPKLHADPFDRLLIAQSILNDAPILTPDKGIRDYGIRTIW